MASTALSAVVASASPVVTLPESSVTALMSAAPATTAAIAETDALALSNVANAASALSSQGLGVLRPFPLDRLPCDQDRQCPSVIFFTRSPFPLSSAFAATSWPLSLQLRPSSCQRRLWLPLQRLSSPQPFSLASSEAVVASANDASNARKFQIS